jgi:hypothetical protein
MPKTAKKRKAAPRKPRAEVKQIAAPAGLPAVRENHPPVNGREIMTEAKIIEAFDALGITSKLDQQKKKLFIAVAREFNLNPLRREIHAVQVGKDDEAGGGTLVPVVGYEVYIDRAEETGRLEYWIIEESGEIDNQDWRKSTYKVTLVIKRRDWPKEFKWTVRYVEAVGLKYVQAKGGHQPNSMWQKRGHFMTQKCAIGQAFRLVFREILRGMPFVDAEIENAENGQEEPEDKGELRAPQAIQTESSIPAPAAPISEPPVKFPTTATGPYGQIMSAINERVKSKEGPMVSLFGGQEALEWKHKVDGARGNPEELQEVQKELESVAGLRRKSIQGGV